MINIGLVLRTYFFGTLAGEDEQGNLYYYSARGFVNRAERRWVIYKGAAEASKIPPPWHAWLHYMVDEAPILDTSGPLWAKPHKENLSGTKHSFLPSGSPLRGGMRENVSSDYQAWIPPKQNKSK